MLVKSSKYTIQKSLVKLPHFLVIIITAIFLQVNNLPLNNQILIALLRVLYQKKACFFNPPRIKGLFGQTICIVLLMLIFFKK